jgi:glycosyltransferase involved in cell wall biosynthesis
MKILHVNYSDTIGGAAIAVLRIHHILLKQGIDSHIIVSEKSSNFKNVEGPKKTIDIIKTFIKKSINRQLKYIFKTNNKNTHSINLIPSGLHKKINKFKPDVVNLHWLGNEMISLKEISKINAKVVWTLHDMWPFCGAEHYTENYRFVEGYNTENRPSDESGIDLNKYVWNQKNKHFKNIKNFICTSSWMLEKAKKSKLLENKNIEEIPLTLDKNFWKPVDDKFSKNFFGIKDEEKVIVFGAENYLKNPRKGFDYFIKAIEKIESKKLCKYKVLLFGTNEKSNLKNLNQNIIHLGRILDEYTLKLIYSAADVVVIPSTMESFGLIALEALHCGSPCVAYEKTSLETLIDHKINGYLVKERSEEDMIDGILWCLNNLKNKKNIISQNTANKFDYKKITNQYLNFLEK